MKRALHLAGLSLDSHPKNLIFSQLRALTPEIRLEPIDNAIANTPNVGLVIIDGIRYNNCASSSLIWLDDYNCSHLRSSLERPN